MLPSTILLPELAILASTSVKAAVTRLLLVVFRLTGNTQSHTGNRQATCLGNDRICVDFKILGQDIPES